MRRRRPTMPSGARKESITRSLGVPGDLLLDLPCLRCEGRKRLRIDNHRGVIEYSLACLRLRTADGEIRIDGDGLLMRDYAFDSVAVEGRIDRVSFV